MLRFLMHFAEGADRPEKLVLGLRSLITALRIECGNAIESVDFLVAEENDPLGTASPYRATVDIHAPNERPFIRRLAAATDELRDLLDLETTTALVGESHVFLHSGPTRFRYQHLMHRNAAHSHESYLEYYRNTHSRYGIETAGIKGYAQFHVDLDASQRFAKLVGVGQWNVDSVSELHVDSVERFVAAIADSTNAADALTDEARFADAERSVGFFSQVDWDPQSRLRPPASR